MPLQVEILECPNCGATVDRREKCCAYCLSPIIIKRTSDMGGKKIANINKYVDFYRMYIKNTQGDSAEIRTALGICLLEKGAYEEALAQFEKAISLMPDNGNCFYYLALTKMKGKRPYMHTLPSIKDICQCLETALKYEEAGRYYYLLFLIQIDFFDKKRLKNGKNAQDLKELAIACEVDDEEIAECNTYCNL